LDVLFNGSCESAAVVSVTNANMAAFKPNN